MNLGSLYLDIKDLFLLFAAALVGCAMYFNWSLWLIPRETALTVAVLLLITRALVRSSDNAVFFYHALVTVALMPFLPFLQVILFFIGGLALMKALKVI